MKQGAAAEEATHTAAAEFGLPDFVYRAELRKLGSGTREPGDGLVIVGDLGVAIQVKSRVELTTDPEKERRWLTGVIDKAVKQGAGTIRQLKLKPTTLTNRRDRTFEIDGNDQTWIVCVIIDHPDPPSGVMPALDAAKSPTAVILRRDWEFLFEHLNSMHAVARYLKRVAGDPVELGTEPARYYELAKADLVAAPSEIDVALLGPDGQPISTPLLPLEPAGLDDAAGHRMVRIIQEDIALSPVSAEGTEYDRLAILADIDRFPVAARAELGRLLLQSLDDVDAVPTGETVWRYRRLAGELPGGRIFQLGFGVCSASYSEMHHDVFATWVMWRHYQLQGRVDRDRDIRTVGVLLTPRYDSRRDWDTTMNSLDVPIELSPEEIKTYTELWESQSAMV